MPQTKGSHPFTPGGRHHDGWDSALQDALNKMTAPPWKKGNNEVQVTFQLEIDVQSPGRIGFYQVTIDG